MKAEFEITGDILIVKLSGEIDHHEAAALRNEIDGTFRVFGSRDMILDFSGVSFVDSSGIGVVMGRYNKVKEKGGTLLICGCSDYLRTILSMSGIFTIVRESEDAETGAALLQAAGSGAAGTQDAAESMDKAAPDAEREEKENCMQNGGKQDDGEA